MKKRKRHKHKNRRTSTIFVRNTLGAARRSISEMRDEKGERLFEPDVATDRKKVS